MDDVLVLICGHCVRDLRAFALVCRAYAVAAAYTRKRYSFTASVVRKNGTGLDLRGRPVKVAVADYIYVDEVYDGRTLCTYALIIPDPGTQRGNLTRLQYRYWPNDVVDMPDVSPRDCIRAVIAHIRSCLAKREFTYVSARVEVDGVATQRLKFRRALRMMEEYLAAE